jgi:tyrosine-protein phosphatase OCA1
MNFMEDQEIKLHHLGTEGNANAWDPISEEVVLEALELVLDPRNYPLMIMCNLGRHRTGKFSVLSEIPFHNASGTIVGCLRKLQRWSLTAIFEEYRRFAGSKVRVMNEQVQNPLLYRTDIIPIVAIVH